MTRNISIRDTVVMRAILVGMLTIITIGLAVPLVHSNNTITSMNNTNKQTKTNISNENIPLFNSLSGVTNMKNKIQTSTELNKVKEAELSSLQNSIEQLKTKSSVKQYSAKDLEWDLDIPRALLSLQQTASENNVKLIIDYHNKDSEMEVPAKNITDSNTAQTDKTTKTEVIKSTAPNDNKDKQAASVITPEKQGGLKPLDKESNRNSNGLSKYNLMVHVTGEYDDINNYLAKLSSTKFVDVVSLNVKNKLDSVWEAGLNINIHYLNSGG